MRMLTFHRLDPAIPNPWECGCLSHGTLNLSYECAHSSSLHIRSYNSEAIVAETPYLDAVD